MFVQSRMPPLLRQRTNKNRSRAKPLGQPLGHERDKVKLYSNINSLQMRLAEREGFEPPIRLPVCRISSAVLSTTQPPLQALGI